MIPLGQYPPLAPGDPIHRQRQSRSDRLHPAPERFRTRRFDGEVRVVSLQRVVRETKISPLASERKRAFDRMHDRYGSQRGHPGDNPKGDVRRNWSTEYLPSPMSHGGGIGSLLPSHRVRDSSIARRRHVARGANVDWWSKSGASAAR